MLAPEDRLELLRVLRYIGEAEEVDEFAHRVCRELLRLVPGIRSSYNETNVVAHRLAGVIHPDPGRESVERLSGIFERHMFDHPIVRHFETTGEGDVVTWADLDPEGAFFETPLYREFYQPYGIRSQIAFLLPAPPGIHIALVINRDGTAFDDRERRLLSELRPHLVNLYRLVSHAEATRQRDAALADDGWSVVLVDDAGTVLESNPVAVAIGASTGVDLSVGARLREEALWSAMSGAGGALWTTSRAAPPPTMPPPTMPCDQGTVAFEARLLRSAVGPHLLWIREPSRVTVEDGVALGLTGRQAQIALLLVDGLTNDQIANRLGIASGTVRKHLEAIFDRLGVRSRAGAVGRLRSVARVTRREPTIPSL